MSSRSSKSSKNSIDSNFHSQLEDHDVRLQDDGSTVEWNPNCKKHPRNWTTSYKFLLSLVICWLEFVMTAVSTAGTAASEPAREEFEMSETLAIFAFVSVYLIGQLIAGILCSPVSEVFGRRTLYTVSAALFCVASGIVAAPSVAAIYVGRFLQGVAAAIPATVAFGTFNDMFDAHGRVWVVYGYTFAGTAGLTVGPVYSSYTIESIGWRWVFYISAIVSGASAIPCFFLRESNAEQLLAARVKSLKKKMNRDQLVPEGGDHHLSASSFIQNQLYRPFKMLITEPLVLFCAILCGIAFGLVYGLTESLTIVYTATPFEFSKTTASLSFLAILVGISLDLLPRVYDDYLLKKVRKQRRRILPETKIRSFAVACPSLAIGLWLFGWTIPQQVTNVPWPVSMLGLVCIGFSLCDFSYVLFGYVADSYGPYAASAASSISITRTIMAAVFPLFTTQMYEGLGNNNATTILAAAATLFCFTPWVFLTYGNKLRHKSKLAQDDEDCLQDENQHLEEEGKGANGGEYSPTHESDLELASRS